MIHTRTATMVATIVMTLCLAVVPTVGAWSPIDNGLNTDEGLALEPDIQSVTNAADPLTQG